MPTPEEEKEIQKNRDRFKGYQLPKIQLDETGPTYYDVGVHPYFYNQPRFWQQEVFYGHPNGSIDIVDNDIPTTADTPPVIGTTHEAMERGNIDDIPETKDDGFLYPLLPPEK